MSIVIHRLFPYLDGHLDNKLVAIESNNLQIMYAYSNIAIYKVGGWIMALNRVGGKVRILLDHLIPPT